MTMSEYEERFRPPVPSLHQTFAEVRGPNRRTGSRRLWVAAALVGVMTIASNAALQHSTYANGSQVPKSGIITVSRCVRCDECLHFLKPHRRRRHRARNQRLVPVAQ